MNRTTRIIERLQKGETVLIRPYGQSMRGLIESGSLVRIRPLRPEERLQPGDIVLCRVRRKAYLHLIRAVNNESYLIANNVGGTNGWTPRRAIYGKLDAILEPPRSHSL